jgi:hypothetical protein
MFCHDCEDFSESRDVFTREKTPRIPKRCSTNHKSIECCSIRTCSMFIEFFETIVIGKDIAVADYGDFYVFFEFINTSKICLSCKCLLVRPSMNRDQICSSIFESLYKFSEEFMIFPTESCFYGNRDFDCLAHGFYDLKCCISIDHE